MSERVSVSKFMRSRRDFYFYILIKSTNSFEELN